MSEVIIGDSASASSPPERIGPYRIVSRLGRGGMGAVYRAHDERLGRDVALKQLLPEIADDRHARERFVREARAVARLSHSNIVQIFDVMEADGQDWIVLELVEGRTLAESMAGGKLPLSQALALAHEMAQGLAAAHAEGIVHRDLKAKNVIVSDEGQVKILDFGLAKQLTPQEGDASLSATGGLIGTPQAMSPEQVLRKTVDHRSDLFSLGSLLYEMVTGISPFLDSTPVETMKKVFDHRQTAASELDSDVPFEVSALIDQLLEKKPARRPQSAAHVVRALEDLRLRPDSSTSSFSSRPSYPRTLSRRWSAVARRRWVVAVAVLGTLVAAFAMLRWSNPRSPETLDVAASDVAASTRARPIGERPRIVVGHLDNQTGESTLDEALNLAFRIGLEQSRHTLVLPGSQIREVLRRMNRDPETTIIDPVVGVEICKRESANALVTGSIVKIGGLYQLNANIIDPWTGISSFSNSTVAESLDGIVSALDELTREIRNHLGESLSSIEATIRLERVTTSDLEALKAYSAGERLLFEDAYSEARQLFHRAIEKDPEFAMAHAKLGIFYIEVEHEYDEALRHLDRALELSDRLTDYEVLYVKGWLARLRGTPQDIVDAWSSMTSLFPDQVVGHINLAMASYFLFRRFDKAAASFEEALRVDESFHGRLLMFGNYGICQLALGQSDKALQSFHKLGAPWYMMTFYHLVVEDYEQARIALEEPRTLSGPTDRLWQSRMRMVYQAGVGRFDQAEASARAFRRLAAELGDAEHELGGLLNLAVVLERSGSEEELRGILDSGFRIAEHLLAAELEPGPDPTVTLSGIHHLPVQFFALLGKVGARNSALSAARRLQSKIQRVAEERELPFWISLSKMLEGEILAAGGDYPSAIARLQEAQAYADSFQIHESLARFHRATGNIPGAIAGYEWMIANRGFAAAGCSAGCEAFNFLEFDMAFYHLARLYDEAGDQQEAIRYYQKFVDRWREAEDLPEWRSARQRLSELSV